jgi:hypothetical protein
MSTPLWMLDALAVRARLEDERRDAEARRRTREGILAQVEQGRGTLANPVQIDGDEPRPLGDLLRGRPAPASRTFERTPTGGWHDVGQLDRIELLLQELVDEQRKRALYDELERLTRGWRP